MSEKLPLTIDGIRPVVALRDGTELWVTNRAVLARARYWEYASVLEPVRGDVSCKLWIQGTPPGVTIKETVERLLRWMAMHKDAEPVELLPFLLRRGADEAPAAIYRRLGMEQQLGLVAWYYAAPFADMEWRVGQLENGQEVLWVMENEVLQAVVWPLTMAARHREALHELTRQPAPEGGDA